LHPKGRAKKDAAYLTGVPYQVFEIADEPANSSLEPAPVFDANGNALHLYFEIASEDALEASFTKNKTAEYEALVLDAMKKTGMNREQLKKSGSPCCGITFEVGERKYSIACFYGHKRNVVTTAQHSTQAGFHGRCRGCNSHHTTLNLRLRCTFDPRACLEGRGRNMLQNHEWSSAVSNSKKSQSISFSAVLRVLDNGGFIHIKNQDNLTMIRTTLSKSDQKNYVDRTLAREHYGFRTGALLVLLTEAGINMISFDRSDSSKNIDEVGQTLIADTWGFNRLSNVLSEDETDQVLASLLAGDYADGDAAFIRRNSDVPNPPRLSDEWEAAIERNWKEILNHNSHKRGLKMGLDIRVISLPQILRLCRLNANINGNLVD
jgi:hypothetical protein